jgi:hypothetical protein
MGVIATADIGDAQLMEIAHSRPDLTARKPKAEATDEGRRIAKSERLGAGHRLAGADAQLPVLLRTEVPSEPSARIARGANTPSDAAVFREKR